MTRLEVLDKTHNKKTQEISLTLIYKINEHLQHQVIFFVVCSNVSSGAMKQNVAVINMQ